MEEKKQRERDGVLNLLSAGGRGGAESLGWSPIKGGLSGRLKDKQQKTHFPYLTKFVPKLFCERKRFMNRASYITSTISQTNLAPPSLRPLLHLSLYPCISLRSSAAETTTKGGPLPR